MKITQVQTVRHAAHPNILWVRLYTDTGLIGLGETYYLPGAVESVVHEMIVDFLVGESPFDRERIWDSVFSWANFFGYAGAEMRALSAVDIALWDLLGQATQQPVYNLLGGACRSEIAVYNTCVNSGQFRDQDGFLDAPAALAKDLLSQGVKAMKIWPWDQFAPQLKGRVSMGPAGWSAVGPSGAYISAINVEKGLLSVQRIRDAVGSEMEILIEGHGRWDLNCAIRIARALEPYDVLWMEDMIKPDNAGDLRRLAEATSVPLSVSERLITRFAFREVLENKAARVIMPDLIWTGGITEGHKIAILADTYHLPIAPHDCTGLVTLYANMHLCAASTNAMILETVRGFYQGGWYEQVYSEGVEIRSGVAQIPQRPGLGVQLKESLFTDPNVTTRISS